METPSMGRVLTEATIENLEDLWAIKRGLMRSRLRDASVALFGVVSLPSAKSNRPILSTLPRPPNRVKRTFNCLGNSIAAFRLPWFAVR